MTRREREFEKKTKALIAGVDRLQDNEVRRVMLMLEDARREVASMVASTEWKTYYIPQMKAAVDSAIERLRQRYQSSQSAALQNSFNAGIDMVDLPLSSVGFRFVGPEISRTVLEIGQGYSADLIKGLTADALKRVNGEIMMGIMGGKQPYDVMQAVGKNLDDPGVFGTIASRAEAITRTEMGRINSSAREARIQGTVGNTEPPMKWMKKWVSSGKAKPRKHHAALNGVTIPVDEKFMGYIDYPHAPGLPAKEVVNCG
uniref:Putative capsid morphogenesis protein n=1 Tax=viral metagenome TaxID=1070528 RepID=A0A6M3ITJ9_9ZZZZ